MSSPVIMNRRTFIRKSLGLLGAGMVVGSYPVFIERTWYQIREVSLPVRNLPAAFKGWKIVQFSDVHYGFHFGNRELSRLVRILNGLNPDILLFTGDLVQRGYKDARLMTPLLRKLQARGGKWAVTGNHDHETKDDVINALYGADFTVLLNDHGIIPYKGQHLFIAGVDDVLFGKPDLVQALAGLSKDHCVLLLVHEPDVADTYSQYAVCAQFSGHSHGGQVQIPWVGPLFTPELARKYTHGLYFAGEKKMPLYVNKGIGTSNLPVRLFCRPEITVFYLEDSHDETL